MKEARTWKKGIAVSIRVVSESLQYDPSFMSGLGEVLLRCSESDSRKKYNFKKKKYSFLFSIRE